MMTDVQSEAPASQPPPQRFATPRYEAAHDMRTVDDMLERPQKVVASNVNFFYGQHQALHRLADEASTR